MFVRVTGLSGAGISVPRHLQREATRTCNTNVVNLALVRWLSPHPLALARDTKLRPMCPPPFGTNHALWTYAKTPLQRPYFTDHLFVRQLHLFPGNDTTTKRRNAHNLRYAMYDLVQLETIDTFMNCTCIDNDKDKILETVTLPFY